MTENTTQLTGAEYALSRWLEMWNTGGDLARKICSDDFRIHFTLFEPAGANAGDEIHGAEAFARFLDDYRVGHAANVFTELDHAIDGEHGRMLWALETADERAGGIDVFDFADDGLVREVWSVTGRGGTAL